MPFNTPLHESLITPRTVFLMSTVLCKPETLPFSLQQFQDIDFNINAGNIQMFCTMNLTVPAYHLIFHLQT